MPFRSNGYIPPCIPTRAVKTPAGPGWVHEIKHDGYRLQVRRDGDAVRLFTRRGYDWSGRMTRIRWIALVGAAALAGCAHEPPAATIPATTTTPEPAPAAPPAPAPRSPVKIAPTIAPAPTTPLRADGSQELRDYCKTASRLSCQRASDRRQECFQLKGVAFGIHLQVIAFSRSMSLSEARDLAARNAHELPSDLALAIASQVTPGTLADNFANDIYRRCLTS
jgi:hypothetical protein